MHRRFKRPLWWMLLSSTMLLSGCSLGQVPAATPAKGPYQVVHVVARNFQWQMSNTNLKAGENVKFIVTSIQGVHGFSIEGTAIASAVSEGQAPVVVYWNDPTKGTYVVRCNVYCGTGHDSMTKTFTVS